MVEFIYLLFAMAFFILIGLLLTFLSDKIRTCGHEKSPYWVREERVWLCHGCYNDYAMETYKPKDFNMIPHKGSSISRTLSFLFPRRVKLSCSIIDCRLNKKRQCSGTEIDQEHCGATRNV